MSPDDTRISRILVGLPDVRVLDASDDGEHLEIFIESTSARPECPTCAGGVYLKDRRNLSLVDLPYRGRATRVIWRKRRWRCADSECPQPTWTEQDNRIAFPRHSMLTRAGRWVTLQVGRGGRAVAEVARELGCHWHTVNDAVVAFGEALLDDDPTRIGPVEALGLDEVLFVRLGQRHRQHFTTSIVDVATGQLLDIVPGREGKEPKAWLKKRGAEWLSGISACALDLSGPYRAVYEAVVPHARIVADPFHVVKHANLKLDECRRRVQNETLGHRGHRDDPLYRIRRLLTIAAERLDEHGEAKRVGLLRAGDPRGEVDAAWHAKEAVRDLYTCADAEVAGAFIDELIVDMDDPCWPIEVRSLARTLRRWRDEIVAWHATRISNGPTEAANNLIKRVKRVAFGFTSFRNYRIRSLLYAGRPNWSLLDTVTPR